MSETASEKQWDVFISYASEDRAQVVEPLATALKSRGVRVWYDRDTLKLGDHLRRGVDEGLAHSRFGIVILSPSFFRKHYPNIELDGLAQREVEGQKVILPVWYGLTDAEVRKFSPTLADRTAVLWEQGVDHVVTSILQVIRPEQGSSSKTTSGSDPLQSIEVVQIPLALPVSTSPFVLPTMDEYLGRYLEWPLHKLISSYHEVETSLLGDLEEICKDRLSSAGFVMHRHGYSTAGHRVRLMQDFLTSERRLFLAIKETNPTAPDIHREALVEHFGLIRSISVVYPAYLASYCETLADDLAAAAIAAYTALESAFVASARDLHGLVFREIYDCIEAQLSVSNKARHFGRIFLFVGELPFGNYYFDEAVMRRVIDHYKANQRDTVSPVELTAWIMSEPIPFGKSLGIESWRQRRPLSLPWVKARYKDDAEKIFDAEVALFNSEAYASYSLAESRDYFLDLACPAEVARDVIPEIDKIKKVLENSFNRGLREWSSHILIVRAFASGSAEISAADRFKSRLKRAGLEFIRELVK